ncbi:MAG: hypothetical protein GQ570_11730 [Helicobacteraceae bacterium]|nr:hypothetical protein [Helicobacteraceae bacterium]
MKRRGNKTSGVSTGVYDEDLVYNNTNIATLFPNANNTGIDSTGDVLTATASDGEAISILKTQDIGSNVVVDHTEYISSSGTASASSETAGGYNAWRAFDAVGSIDLWYADGATGWLKYQLTIPEIIVSYNLKGGGLVDRTPTSWTFEGSNNDTNWDVLDTVSGYIFTDVINTFSFAASNVSSYEYYRINITANNGSTLVGLDRFELINSSQTDFTALTSDNIPFEGQFEFANISTQDIILVTKATPEMTSFTSPYGIVSADYSYNNNFEWHIFTDVNIFYSNYLNPLGSNIGNVIYTFPSAITIAKYELSNFNRNAGSGPADWTIQGSNDGTNWDVLDTRTSQIIPITDSYSEYLLSSVGSYTYYKFAFTAGEGSWVEIARLKYYEVAVGSSADTLVTSTPIANGDNLVIVKDDDSVNEVVASGVSDSPFSELSDLDTYTSANLNSIVGIYADADIIYAASSTSDSITSIDISNPSNLVELDSFTSSNLNGANNVAISGNVAYVTSGTSDSVTAIDISNPLSMSEISSFTSSSLNGVSKIVVSGTVAYTYSSISDAFTSIDISNPSIMVELDSFTNETTLNLKGIAISGTVLYSVAQVGNHINSIDISNPSAMVQLDSYIPPSAIDPFGLAISGNVAYIADVTYDGIIAVDISNPSAMVELSTISSVTLDYISSITISGTLAYVVGYDTKRVTIVDISNPSIMVEIGSFISADIGVITTTIAVSGDNVYIPDSQTDSIVSVQVAGREYSMDTTSTTAGEIPSRAYAVDAQPSFEISGGFVDAVLVSDTYGTASLPTLTTTRTYDDLIDSTGSQTVQSKVILKATGDRMTSLQASLNKK